MAITRSGGSFSMTGPSETIKRNTKRFVVAVVGAASTEAMRETPREYGILANSQYSTVVQYPDKVSGFLGYGTNYAKYLNGLPGFAQPSWMPRPIDQKQGPSTNMSAKPGFLTNAFESDSQRAVIKRMEDIFLI